MPHLIVECTKNLESKIDIKQLVSALHTSLENSPGIDMSRLKSRAVLHDYVLNDKNKTEIQMIHTTLSVLSGRNTETKKIYGQTLLNAAKKFVQEAVAKSTSITVEIRDMETDTYAR